MNRKKIIETRRSFAAPGYTTLQQVGMDGDYVSPYQIISNSKDGPCLVAYNWLDAPSAKLHAQTLRRLGYLPGIPFNNVLDLALGFAGLTRKQIYVTQAFHLLPDGRSQTIPQRLVDQSFDAITRHEIAGRRVVALGDAAWRACNRFGIDAIPVCHPSSRNNGSYDDRARLIADAIGKARL
jgi:hypothetical protein